LGHNSIGREFVITCFGESHGQCIGVVIDGCPAGLPLSKDDLQRELDRRVPHSPGITSDRRERDEAEILSGVFDNFTTGAPICALVQNQDARPADYAHIQDTPRPGHADYPARIKYGGFNDYRGGGRFSGRITITFVMAGTVAKKLLRRCNIEVLGYTQAIGDIALEQEPSLEEIEARTYDSAVRCPDRRASERMERAILKARERRDSLGGVVQCLALNVPVGIGEPVFDSLDADLAKLLFNIPAVKGVEFGAGFNAARWTGSQNNDPYVVSQGKIVTVTNHAGGILGGISSGMPIRVRVAVKPTPSIAREQRTVDLATKEERSLQITGRHDACIVPKAVPVVEAAVATVLCDHLLRAHIVPRILGGKGP
jgi:chorismate synthase